MMKYGSYLGICHSVFVILSSFDIRPSSFTHPSSWLRYFIASFAFNVTS
jgi:hypothetical protein